MIWYLDPSHEGEERAVRVLVRIMDKVRIGPGPDACWVWIGGRTPTGYGVTSDSVKRGAGDPAEARKSKLKMAHRLMYEILRGQIPPGKVICHKCDNPSCVRPGHLICATQADNVRDCIEKGRR